MNQCKFPRANFTSQYAIATQDIKLLSVPQSIDLLSSISRKQQNKTRAVDTLWLILWLKTHAANTGLAEKTQHPRGQCMTRIRERKAVQTSNVHPPPFSCQQTVALAAPLAAGRKLTHSSDNNTVDIQDQTICPRAWQVPRDMLKHEVHLL